MRPARFLWAVTACLLAVTLNAHAGRSCTAALPDAEATRKGLALAAWTGDSLDRSGAEVALVARVGRDLSRYGLRYSHLGIAWRDHPAGRWFVVHELNTCGSAVSDLYDEGLGNFFLDELFAYEALVVLPPAPAQHRLATGLAHTTVYDMHQPRYNMAAYAFSTRYQNSNQWVLEMLATAFEPTLKPASREAVQAWLKGAGYAPITLSIGALERLGGRMFRANIAFDDHPPERRFAGHIDTVSVESVLRFLERRADRAQSFTITLE